MGRQVLNIDDCTRKRNREFFGWTPERIVDPAVTAIDSAVSFGNILDRVQIEVLESSELGYSPGVVRQRVGAVRPGNGCGVSQTRQRASDR